MQKSDEKVLIEEWASRAHAWIASNRLTVIIDVALFALVIIILVNLYLHPIKV